MTKKKIGIILGIILAVVLLFIGSIFGLLAYNNNQSVATVNGVNIKRSDYDSAIKIQEKSTGNPLAEADKNKLYEGLIQKELLKQQSDKLGIKISDSAIDNYIETLSKKSGMTVSQFYANNVKNGNTKEYIKEQISYYLMYQKLVDMVKGSIKIDPSKIQGEFDKNQGEYYTYDTSNILFKTDSTITDSKAKANDDARAKAAAIDAIARLKNGEDFKKLASEVSEDPGSKTNGGEVGGTTFKDPKFVTEYMDGFKNLKVGEYTIVPVKSKYGYHIIKLNSIDKDEKTIRDEITTSLYQSQWDGAIEKELSDFTAKSKIVRNLTFNTSGNGNASTSTGSTPSATSTGN